MGGRNYSCRPTRAGSKASHRQMLGFRLAGNPSSHIHQALRQELRIMAEFFGGFILDFLLFAE